MKLVAISDTHNQHLKLTVPDGDIFIHTGDATISGSRDELVKALSWIAALPHKVKIFVPGNHDKKGFFNLNKEDEIFPYSEEFPSIKFLLHEVINIDGLRFGGNASMRLSKTNPVKYGEPIGDLPECDVLLTHNAPLGILDECVAWSAIGPMPLNIGDDAVRKYVDLKPPKLHIFGHIHIQGGKTHKAEKTMFMNLAACNDGQLLIRECSVIDTTEIFI